MGPILKSGQSSWFAPSFIISVLQLQHKVTQSGHQFKVPGTLSTVLHFSSLTGTSIGQGPAQDFGEGVAGVAEGHT